jgi:hypothetical protein
MAEFTSNNQIPDSTTMSPFFATFGFHPQLDFELDICTDFPEEVLAQIIAARLSEIYNVVHSEMCYAQAQYQEFGNCSGVPSPDFHMGDTVWLDARNITTTRPS